MIIGVVWNTSFSPGNAKLTLFPVWFPDVYWLVTPLIYYSSQCRMPFLGLSCIFLLTPFSCKYISRICSSTCLSNCLTRSNLARRCLDCSNKSPSFYSLFIRNSLGERLETWECGEKAAWVVANRSGVVVVEVKGRSPKGGSLTRGFERWDEVGVWDRSIGKSAFL